MNLNILAYPKTVRPLMAVLFAVISFFVSTIGNGPSIPYGKELDMSQFELTWADEFDGDTLNTDTWGGHYYHSGTSFVRKGGYWDMKLASVKDGNLHIATEYYPEGLNGNGKPGWYTCGMDTMGAFSQKYGYYECRCILPKGYGLWSAFWMFAEGIGNPEYLNTNGIHGAEIDIFESAFYDNEKDFNRNSVSSCIHIDGYEEHHKQKTISHAYVSNNPYEEYNTYGLVWTEKEYKFYINGVEVGKTTFGVSQEPEWLILSVEVGGDNAVPGESWVGRSIENNTEAPTDFIVDYVRVYQFK